MSAAPSQFPPPVDSAAEFVGAPTDPEDERIEVGVAIVGGGQAGLACAIRLLQLLEDDPETMERLGEVPVAVIEKGRVAGAHQLSGGVMNPSAIRTLLGDDDSWPHWGEVKAETVYFCTKRRAFPLKPTPPPFRNHGNFVVSVAELNRWLGERAEEAGAYLLSETAGAKLLVEGGKVVGVRTGDKGRDKAGGEKSNFEPGSDVIAKATVLAEGNWGHLTGAALKALDLAPKDPQVWALGVKEVWEVPKPFEKIVHTLGWPLRWGAKWKEFGGSWIYGMNREGEAPKVSIGFVTGLDYTDARFSVHDVLQEFKLHPLVRKILADGKRVAWGAKAIPEGGYWAMPTLHAPGMVIAGDAGGMVNVPRLKGIHYAIESGRLAAETIYARLKQGSTDFSAYENAIYDSQMGKELYESRNMKQPFAKGLILGGAITNAMVVTKGRFPGGHWATHRDSEAPLTLSDRHKRYPKPDGKYTFDKLSGVFLTGNATRDDAPSHIRIQTRVPREVGEGWAWMCPAGVYEVPDDAPAEGMIDLIVNPSNCVQCGAITAKGGRLTPPEGGDGPVYQITYHRGMRRLIRGGRVVTATDAFDADVLIDGETVVAVGAGLQADEEIDASGCLVLPGLVDNHTHLSMPFGGTWSCDDYDTGTAAAAAGGTTCIVDFCIQYVGGSLKDALAEWHGRADGAAHIDYGFHVAITDARPEVVAEMERCVAEGVSSFKVFMAYKGALMVDDEQFLAVLEQTGRTGGLVMVHCENGDAVVRYQKEALERGDTAPKFHASTRPPEVEGEATSRAIRLAEWAGRPLFVVHVTCEDAVREIRAARDRGLPIYGETCIQYLYLTVDDLDRPGFEGAKYVCSPPLREARHQEVLYAALRQGALQGISTDHCPFNYKEQKELGLGDFTKIPNGLPAIEHRLTLLYDRSVRPGHMSLVELVRHASWAPARIFGLDRKGAIAPGFDADIVVFDPSVKHTLSAATHAMNVDYDPFEGWEVQGKPRFVLSRGETVYADGAVVSSPGRGRFVKRSLL